MNIDYDDEGFWVDTETGERVFPEPASESWSVSQKEAIRHAIFEIISRERYIKPDGSKYMPELMDEIMTALEAITKGDEQ